MSLLVQVSSRLKEWKVKEEVEEQRRSNSGARCTSRELSTPGVKCHALGVGCQEPGVRCQVPGGLVTSWLSQE